LQAASLYKLNPRYPGAAVGETRLQVVWGAGELRRSNGLIACTLCCSIIEITRLGGVRRPRRSLMIKRGWRRQPILTLDRAWVHHPFLQLHSNQHATTRPSIYDCSNPIPFIFSSFSDPSTCPVFHSFNDLPILSLDQEKSHLRPARERARRRIITWPSHPMSPRQR
jgi:hypothetical protein